ncbi:MAG: glycoside hydrolase family 127 protein, partial [Cyclobacteriaceae bacterium]|nr:glycoside hydrolase family 127 protein [Cyclobacteriaceae bacterium]
MINNIYKKLLCWFIVGAVFSSCSTVEEQEGGVKAFELDKVKLLEGPFKHAVDLNIELLLQYEPDRLLSKFRSEAGLEPKGEHYGGWEKESLAGHTLGHHLSACALMYLTSGDLRFYDRAQYIVNELSAIQDADGEGYLGAFPKGKKIFEEEVAKGVIRAQSFDLNGIWAPFYTHHKVMAGLRDSYRLLGIEKALNVESKFADWIGTVVNPLNDGQLQLMLNCEHGGMNEVLVDLYTDTKEQKYLDMSYRFHHKVVLDSLANHNDILPGIHGNTQIPKLIGLAKRYDVTHNEKDYEAATFFWDRVVNHHSYVTGGHGNFEYFGQPDQLTNRLSDGTTETCNVYNML